MLKLWRALPQSVRDRLRPLAPWRLRARLRQGAAATQVRHNVDVVARNRWNALRWVLGSPTTYRPRAQVSAEEGAVAVGRAPGLVPGSEVTVGAATAPNPPWRRAREPGQRPWGVSLSAAAAAELDVGDASPVEVLRRVRQAGLPYALVPGRGAWRGDAHIPLSGPVAVILAGVPLHGVGGGSRGAQLAFELLVQGFEVVYVHRYGLASAGEDLGLRFIHPGLYELFAEDVDAGMWGRLPSPSLVLVEFPLVAYRDAADRAASAGHRVVYEAIDDWSDPALGLEWYRPETEVELAQRAYGVTASAPDLAARIERLAGSRSRLVPNAVNTRLFDGSPAARPPDLPQAGRVLGYHGSLYGHWFDWDGVRRLAEADDGWAIVLIGAAERGLPLPDNVHLLGPRPQHELPAYLAHFDVGLVPFVVSDMTHAVSPLKVYEYLAAGVPVAAPPLRALAGLDGVHMADDLAQAVRRALDAPAPDGAAARAEHGWDRRVAAILDLAGLAAPGGGHPPRVEVRPVRRYALRQRLADWL